MAVASTRQRLAAAIRARRTDLGLTQEEAAEAAGVSARYWRSLEAGRPAVALEVVERVIEGLDWSWADIGDALALEMSARSVPDSLLRLLDAAWTRATPREREILSGALRTIAGTRRKKVRS